MCFRYYCAAAICIQLQYISHIRIITGAVESSGSKKGRLAHHRDFFEALPLRLEESIHPNHPRLISKVKAICFLSIPGNFCSFANLTQMSLQIFWGGGNPLPFNQKSEVFGWRTQQL